VSKLAHLHRRVDEYRGHDVSGSVSKLEGRNALVQVDLPSIVGGSKTRGVGVLVVGAVEWAQPNSHFGSRGITWYYTCTEISATCTLPGHVSAACTESQTLSHDLQRTAVHTIRYPSLRRLLLQSNKQSNKHQPTCDGDMAAMSRVLVLPPKLSWSSRVKLDSRKGTCWLPDASASMQRPSVCRLRLMFCNSAMCALSIDCARRGRPTNPRTHAPPDDRDAQGARACECVARGRARTTWYR
jgi:hypothetical protein